MRGVGYVDYYVFEAEREAERSEGPKDTWYDTLWGGIFFEEPGENVFGSALAPCFRPPVCVYSFPLCISGCDQHTFLQTQDVPFHGISLLVIS